MNPKVLKVGEVSAKRGEKTTGKLTTFYMRDGSQVDIPVLLINGAKEGPIVSSVSGRHSNELPGTLSTIEIFKMLDPMDVSGAFIGIPMATPTALHHGWRVNTLDLREMTWPGHPGGTITQRISYAVFKHVYEPADLFLSLHANFKPCIPYCRAETTADEEINIWADNIARSTGITNINTPGVNEFPPKPDPFFPDRPPKAVVFIEAEGANTIEERPVRATRKGQLNAMKTAGLVEGELEDMDGDCVTLHPPKGYGFAAYIPPEAGYRGNRIYARRGGLLIKEAEDAFIGRKIEEGTIIARVIDLYGEEVEVIRAPSDGYIWAWPLRTDSGLPCPAVYTGSEVAYWFVEKELREPYKSLY